MIHITYSTKDPGCLHKISRIHTVDSVNVLDYRWGYNDKYNRLQDEFRISLTKVISTES
jgi:hypothetical protein